MYHVLCVLPRWLFNVNVNVNVNVYHVYDQGILHPSDPHIWECFNFSRGRRSLTWTSQSLWTSLVDPPRFRVHAILHWLLLGRVRLSTIHKWAAVVRE